MEPASSSATKQAYFLVLSDAAVVAVLIHPSVTS